MFRRMRTRRAIKVAEKVSGLKNENSIFRGNKKSSSTKSKTTITSTSSPIIDIPNLLTATYSEESDMDIVTLMNYNVNSNEPYDVDVDRTIELYRKEEAAAVNMTITGTFVNSNDPNTQHNTDEIVQLQQIVQEMEINQNEQLAARDAMIHELSNELDRTRQDFLEVIVELNAKDQELSATKQQLDITIYELQNVTKDLFTTKEQLKVHAVTLIQTQHELYDLKEVQKQKQQPQSMFGFLHI